MADLLDGVKTCLRGFSLVEFWFESVLALPLLWEFVVVCSSFQWIHVIVRKTKIICTLCNMFPSNFGRNYMICECFGKETFWPYKVCKVFHVLWIGKLDSCKPNWGRSLFMLHYNFWQVVIYWHAKLICHQIINVPNLQLI